MDLEETLGLLRAIGLSQVEEEMVLITDEPKIPGYLCSPNEEAEKKFNAKEAFGQGFDLDRTRARVKSVGEYLERLCSFNPLEEKFFVAEYTPNNQFVDPALFCCYSEEQLQDREDSLERSRHQTYRWWPVKELGSDRSVFLPAQLIFLSDQFKDEFPIRRERISTGTAFGPTGENYALKGAFFEVVERDACISAYLTKRELRQIVDLPPELSQLIEYLHRYELYPHVFDVTTDLGIPTVLTTTIDHSGVGCAVAVGSRAECDYESAIRRSLLESIQCRRSGRLMRKERFPDGLPTENEITTMENRFFYWHAVERIKDLDFWLDSPLTVSYLELAKRTISFGNAIEAVQNKGYHLFVADLTIPAIKQHGFETLKVVIPELHPLYLDEHAKALYSVHHGSIKDNQSLKPHPLT